MRRHEFVSALSRMVTVGRVIEDEQGCGVYAVDAFGGHAGQPLSVVLPGNVREVTQVLRFCYESGLKVFPRGAGTSLVGGAVGAADGIVLCLSLMNRVLELDPDNRLVRVEAGISTAAISTAAAGKGLRYAPDPASKCATTIGGNIATNAGGARAVRFGATEQHVLALKLALIDGEVIELGGGELESSGLDLVGFVVGSEGLLGVVVEATLRLVPEPPARRVILLGFQSMSAAIACAGQIATSVAVTAMEVFDRQVVNVCEDFANAALPRDVDALLAIEIEGGEDDVAALGATVLSRAENAAPTAQVDVADVAHIDRIWHAFDAAFTALGRLGTVQCVDIAVPPSRLAESMSKIGDIAAHHNLGGASMCRALEGIVRSVFLYDSANPDEVARVSEAMADVARMTREIDGVLAGEHGIGIAKRDALTYKLAAHDMNLHLRLKSAFDTEWLLNNGKVYPLAEQATHAQA
ncbi:MAG: FAD-binding oxidoreductase [Hyphomicrobiaceae bacterium]